MVCHVVFRPSVSKKLRNNDTVCLFGYVYRTFVGSYCCNILRRSLCPRVFHPVCQQKHVFSKFSFPHKISDDYITDVRLNPSPCLATTFIGNQARMGSRRHLPTHPFHCTISSTDQGRHLGEICPSLNFWKKLKNDVKKKSTKKKGVKREKKIFVLRHRVTVLHMQTN